MLFIGQRFWFFFRFRHTLRIVFCLHWFAFANFMPCHDGVFSMISSYLCIIPVFNNTQRHPWPGVQLCRIAYQLGETRTWWLFIMVNWGRKRQNLKLSPLLSSHMSWSHMQCIVAVSCFMVIGQCNFEAWYLAANSRRYDHG